MEINWTLSEPTSKTDLDYAEKQFNVTFPKEYSELVLKYNAAYPEPNCVCVSGKERVFESLLSINEAESNQIFTTVFAHNYRIFKYILAVGFING